jgi:hypothetical protein
MVPVLLLRLDESEVKIGPTSPSSDAHFTEDSRSMNKCGVFFRLIASFCSSQSVDDAFARAEIRPHLSFHIKKEK